MGTPGQALPDGTIGRKGARSFPLIILRVAILLYPAYFLLDWFIYPGTKYAMLAVRLGVTALLLALQAAFPKVPEERRGLVLYAGFLATSVGISALCLIGGDGFRSPYYVGILQVLVVSTLFQDIPKRDYALLMAAIIGQHFLLLFLVPWTWEGVLINVFGLLIFAGVALFAHALLFDLARENRELREILPVCSRCKKVRDDEGYWKEVEYYLKAHAGAEVSHGLCPNCIRELYPEIADEVVGRLEDGTRD